MAIPRRRVVDVDAERAGRMWQHCRWLGVPIVATLPPLLRAFRALVGELDTFLEDQRSGVDA